MTVQERYDRKAAEGEIIGLRRAAADHHESAMFWRRKRNGDSRANSSQAMGDLFQRMADKKAIELGVDL